MKKFIILLVVFSVCAIAHAQVSISGVLSTPKFNGAKDSWPVTNITASASLRGPNNQALVTRTKYDVMPWEHDPRGWYKLSGPAGNYALAFTNPHYFMRPLILNNISLANGDKVTLDVKPAFDYSCFDESIKDEKPATDYYQPFIARGDSITQVGFKLIWDVKGNTGDGDRDLLVSIVKRGEGNPDTWQQIGPERVVPFVSLNNVLTEGVGQRGHLWSVGWNSGEVKVRPGDLYAIHIRCKPGSSFQMYEHPNDGRYRDCFRTGADGKKETQKRSVWASVASDNDGLVIPYNKCLHQESLESGKFAHKWAQTYVAMGRSLASVVFYASGTTEQLPIYRQRVAVRVREGGPDGPIIGPEKIASGSGEWTGDATWGVFSTVYAPGEVSLEPGKTYALEFENLENEFTLHGYINIKHFASGDTGGFAPHLKVKPDDYPAGRAYLDGKTPIDGDIDMQVVEYAAGATDWSQAVDTVNLIKNGDMKQGAINISKDNSRPQEWDRFKVDQDTVFRYVSDASNYDNKFARVMSECGKTCDGGYVQKVSGLNPSESYRVSGKIRSSWVADDQRASMIGYDLTGQTNDPNASAIKWTILPSVSGVFVPYTSDPIRSATDSISVWLRAKNTNKYCSPIGVPALDPFEFRTDFVDFSLRRVVTSAPGESVVTGASVVPLGLDPTGYSEINKKADSLINALPARQVLSGKGMTSKLGLYYLMGDKESEGMLKIADEGHVPIIKTIAEACDRAYRVKTHNPKAIWIIGCDIKIDSRSQTPQQAADSVYDYVTKKFALVPVEWRPMVDFIECTPIMWEPSDGKSALWYSEFLCDLLPQIANLGPRPIVLNSGVGGLPIEPAVLDGMSPGLRLARHLGGAWGCQGYTLKYSKDADLESYYSLRYRRAYDHFRKFDPELSELPMILLEGGVDDTGDENKSGWKARGSLDKYTDWLSWYDSELKKDDQVLGVTLFKIGAPTIWKSFELEPVVPWLEKHYSALIERNGNK